MGFFFGRYFIFTGPQDINIFSDAHMPLVTDDNVKVEVWDVVDKGKSSKGRGRGETEGGKGQTRERERGRGGEERGKTRKVRMGEGTIRGKVKEVRLINS
jgi:hypothetical protein